ncbi:unnamed protein product [Closterium sp. NIES-54]
MSLPPLPPSPALPCLPCVEGRQRAAPHSSSFPPTTAPLQTLHMDVWGPARVSGQGRERYFLLVVDDYTRPSPTARAFRPGPSCPASALHVWGPARVSGEGRERFFLLVVDDYTWYTTVFPLRSKGEVSATLIPWIRTVCLQLRERFGQDLPVLRLYSDRGGEFSSDLLRDFCREEGITQSFTLPGYPQQNGISERRIGLVMEVAHTSMIHAAAPHFLWPFAVRYAAHQLNLWPRVSLPETSPTLRWTGKVGDASVFRVRGSCAFVRDTSAKKLSASAIPCVFLGFVPDAPGWQFYHPTSRRVLPSQDVTFDESVPFYRLLPYPSAPPPPMPLFLAPGPPPVDPLPPQGPAPSGVSQVDPLLGTAPFQVALVSGAAPGAASEGAASGGAEPGGAGSEGAGSGGAEPEGVEPGGAESEGAESGGAEPRGAASAGGPAGASPRLSSEQLREWLVRRPHHRSRAPGAGGAGDTGAGGATVPTGAVGTGGVGCAGFGDPTEPGAAGAVGTGAGVAGVGGPGAGGAGAAGAGVGGTGAGGARAAGTGAVDPGARGTGDPRARGTGASAGSWCPPASPLPAPSPYTEKSGSLTERREPVSRPVSPVRTARRAPRLRPPPVPGTHTMTLRPSSVPLRVPLSAPPESSLPKVPEPESNRARAPSPTVAHLLATAVTDPSFESVAASALVAELLDFAAARCLDYATALVAESVSACPPSVGGECALGTDVLEDRQEDFECLAAAVPLFASMLLAPEGDPDAPDILAPCSYAEAIMGTYVNEVPPPGANIVDGMWIFRVKRPPGSPPAFKARYVARGFSQRQGVDYFQTFSPTPKMTTLRVLLHVAAQRDYELHSLDFSTAFLHGSLHEEIWLRRAPGFTGTFPASTQWSLCRPVYGLHQAPREWHDTLRATLAALGFSPSTVDPSLFPCTDTSLPLFYVLMCVDDLIFTTADTEALTLVKSIYLGLQITQDRARHTITLTQSHMVHQVLQRFGFHYSSPQLTPLSTSHSLSDPPLNESVEPSGPYPELVGCLMYLMTCTRPDLAYPLSLLARYVAPGRHRKVHLDAAKRVLRYLCSTSGMGLVLGGRSPVVLTGHAAASWELRWLMYLLTGLEEQPRSPPVVYVVNKAMIDLCQEHRLEHITKHIALRYFLARELQQCGQLRLAYVATRANTADVFTKALPPACGGGGSWSGQQQQQRVRPLFWEQQQLSSLACVEEVSVDACGSASSVEVPAEALHTFTLDSGAPRCFFRDYTIVTPLRAPFCVTLADPSSSPDIACGSTILSCLAVPTGSVEGLHLPSFTTNLVSTSVLQDMPWSGLYTLHTESAQVVASGQVATSFSCRLLTQPSLLWHHHLGHPSLQHLCCMHSRLLTGLPRSLPPLSPLLALSCTPCIERRQRVAPHSSSFPPTTAPLQTLHMDVWGPAPVSGPCRECYFLLVVNKYTRYTAVFPLRHKGDVHLPVLRLQFDRGGNAAGGAGGTGAGGAGAGGGDGGDGGSGGGGTSNGGVRGSGARGTGAGGTAAGGTVVGGAAQPRQRRPFFKEQPQSSLPPPGSALHQVLHLPSTSVEQPTTGNVPPLWPTG